MIDLYGHGFWENHNALSHIVEVISSVGVESPLSVVSRRIFLVSATVTVCGTCFPGIVTVTGIISLSIKA